MYVYSEYYEHVTKCNMQYYLENIMKDMGYTIIKETTKSEFKVTANIEVLNDKNKMILEQHFNDEDIDAKMKQSIIRKLDIIGTIDINDFVKELLINDSKFSHYLNFRRFKNYDFNKKLLMINDFDETASSNLYLKFSYYKELTNELCIENNFEFNYDTDKIRFNDKLNGDVLMDKIEKAKKLFNLRGVKYNKFDEEGGHKKLYNMCVVICRQLFGYEMVNTIIKYIGLKEKRIAISKYYLNDKLYEKLRRLFINNNS